LAGPRGEARAHQGPPYPVLSDARSGPYTVSIWADPDVTDDHSPAGRFWIVVAPPSTEGARVELSVRPLDRAGAAPAAVAASAAGRGQFFAAVPLDHEGRWEVRARVDGPLGAGAAVAPFDATYDLRPPLMATLVFLLPFAGVGLIWLKVMGRRRARRLDISTPPGVV
jgi:hypothetical protein